jgi:hypothetical protein
MSIFRIFIYLTFYLQFLIARGTTFVPLTIEDQINNASGAAEVQFVGAFSFKKENGIFTEYKFKVLESVNLDESDIQDNYLKLTMLGGAVDGVVSVIEGAPTFSEGTKYFLLLKKINGINYLSNFTLGKFNIIEFENKEFLISEVFPNVPNVGRISKNQMLKMLREKLEKKKAEEQKIIFNNLSHGKKDRAPSSERVTFKKEQFLNNNSKYFYQIILLALLVTFLISFYLLRKK